jgi:hypothetical protein
VLSEGVYYFDTLIIESQGTVEVIGEVTLNIATQLINRGAIVGMENNHINYLGSYEMITESDLSTNLTAPNAQVTVREDFTGTLTAGRVVVDNDSTLVCAPCVNCD